MITCSVLLAAHLLGQASSPAPPSAPSVPPVPSPVSSALAAPARVPVVVLDLRADGVDPALSSAVSSTTATGLDALGVLQVTTEEDLRRLMDFEQLKLVLACQDEATCLRSFDKALGASLLITGSVGKSGESTVVGLVLSDLEKGTPVARESVTIGAPAQLAPELRLATARLMRSVLARHAGALVVATSEPGATVLLDGVAIGVSPLRKSDVPAGPHRVQAQKDGFFDSVVDVTVAPASSANASLLLSPSPALRETHRRNNWALRAGSLSAAGLGAASVVGGAWVWFTQYDLMTNAETGYAGRYGESESGAALLPAAKYNEISSLRLTSYVLMGAAVPLAATAAILWGVSDDPGRYDALVDAASDDVDVDVAASASASAAP